MTFLSEDTFTDQVIDLATMNGWLVHHDRGKMQQHIHGHVGFPDLCLIHEARKAVVFAELKVGTRKPTAEQRKWLQAISQVNNRANGGVYGFVWYPRDLPSIIRILGFGGAR